jgi:hypothetical protein
VSRVYVQANGLVQLLDQLRAQVDADELAVVRIQADDPVDWTTFPATSCDLPGAAVDQSADFRYSLTDGSGLHIQQFPAGHFEAHIDVCDACSSPVEHAATETRAVEFAAMAASGVGLLAWALSGSGKVALAAAGVAAVGGGLVGANTPKKRRKVHALRSFLNR